ncbi:hypothetical protein [Haloarchaeobius sp. HME9146]|uniref:hypothetical protein n=1 Tax=Haloarchaeobius sp. HME9146 TaxID=2978732 RepID=UPI0021C0B3B7|nr:hypothetical protein [Haloarchaeobius sp. HME9146]MCT9097001.1 hypothetical protein [Haloarchaeobius sp. HME9146]
MTTGSQTAVSSATATEQEQTTDQPDEPEFPMGLSENGATQLLYSAHVQALLQTSFHVEWSKLDLTNSELRWQKEYQADVGQALGSWTRQNGGPVRIFRQGSEAYWREELGDRTTYGKDNEGFQIGKVAWSVEIQKLLEAFSWGAPELVSESPAVWQIEATGIETPSAVPGHMEGEVLDLTAGAMTVTAGGVIRTSEATYKVRRLDGQELRVSSQYTVDSLGEVTVDAPSWLPTARENAPTIEASLTDDRRFVRFEVVAGNRLEPGSRITVFADDQQTKTVVPLEQALEPGVVAYLYRDGEMATGVARGRIERGSVPSDVSPAPFEKSYNVTAFRTTNNYCERVPVSE